MAIPVKSDMDLGNVAKLKNVPPSALDGEVVVHQQLRAAIEGLAWKDSCRVATQGNLNLASPGASIDGITMASGDRVLVRNQTDPIENGIYVWTGAATLMTRALDADTFDKLEQATVSVEEGSDGDTSWRQTATNGAVGTDAISWSPLGSSVPDASETTKGKIEIADQTETDAGSDDTRALTPLKLANWSGRKRKYTANLGDGSATQFDITHNFNTRDVQVTVYTNSGSYETVFCDVERTGVNAVRVTFAEAPSSNAYRAVVLG